jgi:hypothetical protein
MPENPGIAYRLAYMSNSPSRGIRCAITLCMGREVRVAAVDRQPPPVRPGRYDPGLDKNLWDLVACRPTRRRYEQVFHSGCLCDEQEREPGNFRRCLRAVPGDQTLGTVARPNSADQRLAEFSPAEQAAQEGAENGCPHNSVLASLKRERPLQPAQLASSDHGPQLHHGSTRAIYSNIRNESKDPALIPLGPAHVLDSTTLFKTSLMIE